MRLVEAFASQAVIAIENARLFSELQESNATLKEALEQQTATSEILRVIASSPSDVQPVLDAIVRAACVLLETADATLLRLDGDRLIGVAGHASGRQFSLADPGVGLALAHSTIAGRAALERRSMHVPDMAALVESDGFDPAVIESGVRAGIRTLLAAPLLAEGEPVGAIVLRRRDVRPYSERQIALIESFAAQAVIAIENARLFNELRARDDRRRQELERAAAIQQRLLPPVVEGWPGALELAVRFRPAVETSGDFYDVLPLPAAEKGALEPLQIAVGDVAGKGMSAALVTALARAALHATASVPTRMVSPAGALREAGGRLHRDVGTGHFVACALAVLEPPNLLHAGPRFTLSNAAQVPVLLVRGGAAQEIEPPGDRLPLGARPDGDYQDARVDLRHGDVVVFSSDGLVEAPALPSAAVGGHLAPLARDGELFGFPRLAASAAHWSSQAHTAEAVAAGIWSDLTSWCGSESHHDDMTLLVLRVPTS